MLERDSGAVIQVVSPRVPLFTRRYSSFFAFLVRDYMDASTSPKRNQPVDAAPSFIARKASRD